MAATQRLLVLGGTGFVGREICRRAAKVGFNVTSLSRRGRIPYTFLAGEDLRDWERLITWRSGDATNKEIMETLVPEHDAIIHSIGIMFENSLNTLVSGSRSSATGISYELANMESALVPLSILERTPSQGSPKPFIFVSAAAAPPFLKRYLTTKHAVEKKMKECEEKKVIRSVIFRPGIVYHHSKWTSLVIAKAASISNSIDNMAMSKLGFHIGVPEPTPLDLLATAAIRAVARPDAHGIYTNKEMWELTAAESPEI